MDNNAALQLQPVTEEAIPLLQKISIDTFRETFAGSNTEEDMERYLGENMSGERLLAEWHTPGSAFYFALVNDVPAGYLKINTGEAQTELRGTTTLEVERIYVLQQFQGRQIGLYLMQQAMYMAREKQLEEIWLGVWEHNRKAIAFYEKLGFFAFGKHIFRLGTDEQTDIMMRLRL